MRDADIRFELENQSLAFYAGQDVRGNVHVIVHNTIKPRKIKIELSGKVHASFSRGSGKNRRHYSATSKFLEEHIHIWEPNRNGASDSLAPGDYRFPFCFRLSVGREYPPVFSGYHEYIRYELEGNIDLAWEFDPTAEIKLHVTGLYNAGDSKYQVGVEDQDTKTICCLCCASAPITCKLMLPVSGAIPGDAIKPVITVNNPSDRPMMGVKLILMQTVDYRAQGAHACTVDTHHVLDFPENIPPGTQSITLTKDAVIPAGLIPSFSSSIITISYKMVAILEMPSFVYNLDTSVPIFIGNSRTVIAYTTNPTPSQPPQGYQPQGYPPPQGYQPQSYPPPGYQPQSYPPPQGYQPQSYPPPGYQPQAHPPHVQEIQ